MTQEIICENYKCYYNEGTGCTKKHVSIIKNDIDGSYGCAITMTPQDK